MCVRTPEQVREKLSDMKKKFFFREENRQRKTTTNKQTNKQNNNKKQTNKTWGTGAVQDKPFDELLMFIVSKVFSAVLCENGR